MKILGTGLTGLVGSRIIGLLSGRYEFENISKSSGTDITNENQVLEKIKKSNAQIVLHLAAKTDVDGCEKDKLLGQKGEAWKINVEGTRNVANACSKVKKKLVYISTDFVFDGTKEIYFEEDTPNPLNWYAQTKFEGEKIVQSLKIPWVIVRTAYPYRAEFARLDFVRAMLRGLQGGLTITAVTDHVFTPTLIDDFVFAIEALTKNNYTGIFHIVGSQSLTPYDAALLIAKTFGLNQSLISKTTREEFFKDRAPRPFQLAMNNDKITELDVRMRTFKEGVMELKTQMSKVKTKT